MTRRREHPRWPNARPDITSDELARRYRDGESSKRLAREFSCSVRTVLLRLRKLGVEIRPVGKVKSFVSGHGHNWKGEAASYQSKHRRVYARFGQPSACSSCGRTDDAVEYDWANLTGNYNDLADYARMCRPCHRRYDYARAKGVAA